MNRKRPISQLFSLNLFLPELFFLLIILLWTPVTVFAEEGSLVEKQLIPTNGAYTWESFIIDGETYLAVTNQFDGSTYYNNSIIYKWNGISFVEIQSILTVGAVDWESFTIGEVPYLAVANHYDGGSYVTNSKIYRWNGSSFEEFQVIQTEGGHDWESFIINGNIYLAVANTQRSHTIKDVDSKIYKWDGTSFSEFQSIRTMGAYDWKHFTIGNEHFLAVAYHKDNSGSTALMSKIYKWDSNLVGFEEFQSILTYGARDWESFIINGETYLAVANHENGTNNKEIESILYKWNGSSFIEYQAIPTIGAYDAESFEISGEVFLAIAFSDDAITDNIESKIYKWNNSTFVEFEAIPTNAARSWKSFSISGDNYLAIANFHGDAGFNIDSKIFYFIPQNQLPIANAGENIAISTEDLNLTIIQGTASDEDPGDILQYRWLEGNNILLDWSSVGENGDCPLDLSANSFDIGTHTLVLEVTDGQATVSDQMILTIENSAPHAAPTGEGVYEVNTTVTLGGNVSDYDGDLLYYQWTEGTEIYCSGTMQTTAEGIPVELPACPLQYLAIGLHTITLSVDDSINEPVSSDIIVEIVDRTVPTLAPDPNKTILWPPNHEMVNISIEANAVDNSGLPVTLSAVVTSNEPENGLGDGDMTPDWTDPVIDQQNGIITLQLRSERSGSGDGRVYTVSITAIDESGNTSTADVDIIVPHDRRK